MEGKHWAIVAVVFLLVAGGERIAAVVADSNNDTDRLIEACERMEEPELVLDCITEIG